MHRRDQKCIKNNFWSENLKERDNLGHMCSCEHYVKVDFKEIKC
jgi:hypothetical protein